MFLMFFNHEEGEMFEDLWKRLYVTSKIKGSRGAAM
jgi:hypothetical protein